MLPFQASSNLTVNFCNFYLQYYLKIFTSEELILKIMWKLTFLLSTGYMIYSCSLLLIDYLEYPTSVSIDTKHEIPTKFLAVTICNQKLVLSKN